MIEVLLLSALQLFWAFVGAFISIFLPIAFSVFRQRNNKNIFGQWHSSYQDIEPSGGKWVEENVTISRKFGNTVIKNHTCSAGYNYTATALSIENECLSGSWISNRPGASAKGIFMLCINPQGTILYGFWAGPDGSHARRYGRWVITRKKDDTPNAKILLDRMIKPRISGTKSIKNNQSSIIEEPKSQES